MVVRPFNNDEGYSKFPEKIDVLELIISILGEHEKKLDELVTKLEVVTEVLSRADYEGAQ